MKLNDYFLNLMYNPEFGPGDFLTVGLNSDNTTIRDKNDYKDLDIVKNNPIFQTDGKFDDDKFDLIYNKAMFGFLQMSETGSNERLASSYSAFRDDIFAKSGTKKQESETFITKIANPNRQTIGFVSSNIMEAPTQSVREVALALKVWNGEKWIDAPNDDTIGAFFNPKVLAQWDFDADINGNPTKDKDKVVYRKGEKKINPITGTYYYETLNGRDIYGREVLSGWDTFTVDGSTLNKYDFFDSDDLDKSSGGSFLKAAVKVAPALIPTISPWYIAARVGLSMADLAGKVMKMTTGSDNETASWLEGLNAAFTLSTSDYARGSSEMGIEAHPWGLENMLNLGADVFTQLAEQRWLFTHGSSLLSGNGKLGFSKKALEAFKTLKLKEILQKLGNRLVLSEDETMVDLFAASAAEASAMLDKKLASSSKFGEYMSKLYMTGITVADSYGEAKEAGLSDIEAALFTLGYGLGEYGILNTNLGEHILPELRAEKRRMLAALTKLSGVELEAKKDTRKWYKRILSDAKEAIAGDYNDAKVAAAYKAKSPGKAVALSVASNALGEGLEEVSEELWYDIAKSLQNAAVSIGLTQSGNKMEAFDGGSLEKVASRYALNFVGGVIGGGIAVGLPGFQLGIKNMLGYDMSKQQAYLEVVALVRNGKKEELYKTIDKLELADENLAASKIGQGTKDDNLNLANKKLLKGTVDMIEKLLNVHGADIDDHSVLKGISEDARGLIRFQTLLGTLEKEGSTILASYVQRFNSLATRMASVSALIEALENKNGDKAANLSSQEQLELSNLKIELNQLLKLRDNYFNGEMAKIVMPKILFELSASLSTPYIATNFKDYVEKVEHRVISDIPEERLELLKQEWLEYKDGSYKDDFSQVYGYFDYINRKFSDKLLQFDLNYFKNVNDFAQQTGNIFVTAEEQLRNPQLTPEDVQRGATEYHLTNSISNNPKALRTVAALRELATFVGNLDYVQELDILRNLPESLEELRTTLTERGEDADFIINSNFLPYLLEASREFLHKEFEESDIPKIRKVAIQHIGHDLLTNPTNSEDIKKILNNIRYMNLSTKDFLKGDLFREFMAFDGDHNDIMDLFDEDDPELERIQSLLSEFSKIVTDKLISPIDELADEFLLSIGDESKPISQIIKDLDILAKLLANKNKIETFNIEEAIEKQISHALQVLNLLKTHILAARKDGAKLGNLYGFNYVMNSLDPDSKLVEIDKEIADTLLQDLAKTESRIIHYLNLFNINSGLKLAELKKIKSRIDYNFINKVKKYIVSIIPDDWKGKETLEAIDTSTFDELSKKEGDPKYDITQEQRNSLLKESILLLDALYDFFQANKDKILNGGLKDIVSKFKLLPSSSDISKTYNGTTINNKLEDIDDRTLVYILATAASVKASDFYELMKISIDPRYAPIPGLELATKMSYSFLMNLPMFEAFGKAYNEQILKETQALSKSDAEFYYNNYNKIISSESLLDSSYALQFLHTFLVEGIPGAGKSTGYYSVLINMLKKSRPELLKKVMIIHTSSDKATKLGKEIGLEDGQIEGLSKEEYLKKIFPNYKPSIYENGIILEKLENLHLDEETGIYHWKDVEIAKDLDIPTLVIFDESTRFSQQEMLVSEKFQSEFGVHAIATGDYDQIGAVGLIEEPGGGVIYLNTFLDNFFHSPKLGTSMRTENKIKDLNIDNFRQAKDGYIKELRANGYVNSKTDLKYYEDTTGLYGEKLLSRDSDTLDSTIGLMLDTLKDGEIINFIADNKESELYKKLLDLNENHEKYKGKIRFIDSGTAQGEEALYYIVDLNLRDIGPITKENQGNHEHFVNTFYTAISRSKQGTLIIKNNNIDNIVTSTKVDDLIKSPLSLLAITTYGDEFIKSLEEIHGDYNNIKYESIAKSRKKKLNPEPKEDLEDLEDEDILALKLNIRKYPIKNDNPNEYNMLMHSMPVSETGFIKGPDGKFRVSNEEAYKYRIDGLNGLTKLGDLTQKKTTFGLNSDKTLTNLDAALRILNSITQAGLYMDNKEDIKKHIIDLLGLTLSEDEVGIDFMYMIKSDDESYVPRKGIFNRLFTSPIETLIGIFRGKNAPNTIENAKLNKYLAMNIYQVVKGEEGKETRKNFLTVPLTIFTSPLTMMETEGFELLKDIFVNRASRDMNVMISLLLNDEDVKKLPNAEKLLDSLLIYTYKSMNGDVVVYLDNFIPARDAKAISGPSITVSDSKGYKYHFTDEYQYDGEYVELKDIDLSVHHISKDVYFTTEDVLNSDGDVIIPKGHRFVLVSDIDNYSNDKAMIDDFVKNELGSKPSGRISVIYVSAPKVSISDYFLNFALQYKGAKLRNADEVRIDTSIGIETTDFRLSLFIASNNSAFDEYMKLLTSDDSNKTSMLVRWNIYKNIINLITLNAKTSELLLDILNTPLSETEYLDLITVDDSVDDNIKLVINGLRHSYKDGKGKETTVKQFISNQLFNFIIKNNKGFSDVVNWTSSGELELQNFIKDNISKLEECLPDKWKEGIYIRLLPKDESHQINSGENTFVPIRSNNYEAETDNVKVGNRAIRINGKIDTTVHVMEVGGLMKTILDTINDDNKKAYQAEWYVKDSRPHKKETPKKGIEVPQEIKNKYVGENIQAIVNANESEFKDFNWNSDKELLKILNKVGYGIWLNDLNNMIIKLPKESLQFYPSNIVKTPDGKFNIILGGDTIAKLTSETLQMELERIYRGNVQNIVKSFETWEFNDRLNIAVGGDENANLLKEAAEFVKAQKQGDSNLVSRENLLEQILLLDPSVVIPYINENYLLDEVEPIKSLLDLIDYTEMAIDLGYGLVFKEVTDENNLKSIFDNIKKLSEEDNDNNSCNV